MITTRSVLIYIKDKAQAVREFYRVLRPGGRISLSEPINVLMVDSDPDLLYGYDVTPVRALAAKVDDGPVRWHAAGKILADRPVLATEHIGVAMESDHVTVAQRLLDLGVDPNLRDRRFDGTALDWARHLGRQRLIDLLAPVTGDPATMPA